MKTTEKITERNMEMNRDRNTAALADETSVRTGKNRRKRVYRCSLCLGLALALALSLTACGGSGSKADSTAAQQTVTAAADAAQTSDASQTADAAQTEAAQDAETAHASDASDRKTEITGDMTVTSTVNGGVTQEGSVFTITAAGTYTFTGALADGQIVVDAEDEKVEIVLAGASITCTTDAPIRVIDADKVTVTAAAGTYNEINDARALRSADASGDAAGAVYAKCDLVLAGTGSLVVTASYNNGIHTTKDLTVKEITLKVTAPNNALKGNDSVTVESGQLTVISTGGDGIETENTDVSSKGNQRGTVTISGGVLDIYAAGDGISAAYDVEISKGNAAVNIYTDSYSPYTGDETGTSAAMAYLIVTPSLYQSYAAFGACYYNDDVSDGVWVSAEYAMDCYSGRSTYYALKIDAPSGYENVAYCAFTSQDVTSGDYAASTNGGAVNSSMNAYLITDASGSSLSGDYVSLSTESGSGSTSSAKGIKADNEIRIYDGTITVQSTDDAVHANGGTALENGAAGAGNISVAGGTLTLSTGDDGIHADGTVEITDGTVNILTSYEGLEGNVVKVSGGVTKIYALDDGVNACSGSATPLVLVTGGTLTVTTRSGDTDGIDSNGNYQQTGGLVLVQGGSTSGGMAGSVDVDGSVSVTGGTIIALGGICEVPSGTGACCTVVMSGQSFSAGTYQVTDAGGNVLVEFTVDGTYQNGWISSEKLSQGGSYTLSRDGSSVYTWTQSSQTEGSGGMGGFGGGGFGGGGFGGGGQGGRSQGGGRR